MNSQYKKISLHDLSKGFILACITSFIATTEQLITVLVNTGVFNLSWQVFKPGIVVALMAGSGYLIKNYFTNSKDQFGKPEAETKQPIP